MTIDDWLLDLDPIRRRRRLREKVTDEDSPLGLKPVDADQGHLGSPITVEAKTSPDAFLMEITDLGRGEHAGDSDYYRTTYSD